MTEPGAVPEPRPRRRHVPEAPRSVSCCVSQTIRSITVLTRDLYSITTDACECTLRSGLGGTHTDYFAFLGMHD